MNVKITLTDQGMLVSTCCNNNVQVYGDVDGLLVIDLSGAGCVHMRYIPHRHRQIPVCAMLSC